MQQAGQFVLSESGLTRQAAALGGALWYVAQRALAILALLAFTYGLLAAEVELAKIEQLNRTGRALVTNTIDSELARAHWFQHQ